MKLVSLVKITIAFTVSITIASPLCFALPRTQAEWVKEALATSEESLLREGRFRCEHTFLPNAYFRVEPAIAFGPDLERAQKNVFLMCVKKRCEGLNREISEAVKELRKLSDQEFSDYLRIWGQPPAQVESALQSRQDPVPLAPTCQTPSQIEAVFGGCYMAHIKVQCEPVK